jgi:hypothetical protein
MQNDELNQEGKSQVSEKSSTAAQELEHKLNLTGWALFFIWVGIAFLLNFSVGVGLLGIGIITLGMQAFRKYSNLKLEGFWVVIGLLFLLAGLWELFQADIPLVPIVLIIAGITLLISIIRRKHPTKK